jgi:hypothetical protein
MKELRQLPVRDNRVTKIDRCAPLAEAAVTLLKEGQYIQRNRVPIIAYRLLS